MKELYFSLVTFLFLAAANAQIVNIPDPVFKALLLEASPSNQIASTQTPVYDSANGTSSVSSYNTVDTNNDGEIQVSEAQTIKYLFVISNSITNLEGILSFTNIINLNCSESQLSSLNVQGLTNLQTLFCSYSQLTSLNVQGLTNLQSLHCYNNQLTSLNVQGLTNLQNLHCDNNQLLLLDVHGLTNLQILNCSFNLLTSLNVEGLINLISLTCENNQLPSLNVQGLTNIQNFNCYNNLLTSLNVQGLINLHYLDCSNNLLTILNLKNGNTYWQPLYFYANPNLAYICVDEEDITFVQFKVNQYGYSSTCQVNSYCNFTLGGTFYTIQGDNKIDVNNNGCDNNDSVYPNLKFNITNGTISGSLISNDSGNYSIPVSAGTQTLTPQFENPTYFTSSPTSATETFPPTTSPFTQDFCITPNGVHHDLEVVIIPITPARPGFNATYKIIYKNKGNQVENGTVSFNYENYDALDFVSSFPVFDSQTIDFYSHNLYWNYTNLLPLESRAITVELNLNSPTETPPINNGDILSMLSTITPYDTDEFIIDNSTPLRQIVVGSFDPNDKTCLEGATINPSNIGKYVHYKIRFENTGTFAAQNIVVKDMVDTTKFDIASLQMTDASHSCVTKISDTNKVEFIFENINLPFDDANNDGYVVFKIKTKPTLVVGNTISNSANIYFDYNFPIVTNTATSTFSVLQNDTFEFDNYFTIYPNPVAEVLNLNTKQDTEIYSLTIYNLLGQQVQTTTNPTNPVDVSSLKTGNYIVKVVTDKGVSSSKFVKE